MFEIVAGDYGSPYKIIVKGLDLSLCTAKMSVWRNSTYLFQDKDCGVVTYEPDKDESFCYYTVSDGNFPSTAAVDGRKTEYECMVEFTKAGYKEHDLGFKWIVYPAPPSGEE